MSGVCACVSCVIECLSVCLTDCVCLSVSVSVPSCLVVPPAPDSRSKEREALRGGRGGEREKRRGREGEGERERGRDPLRSASPSSEAHGSSPTEMRQGCRAKLPPLEPLTIARQALHGRARIAAARECGITVVRNRAFKASAIEVAVRDGMPARGGRAPGERPDAADAAASLAPEDAAAARRRADSPRARV